MVSPPIGPGLPRYLRDRLAPLALVVGLVGAVTVACSTSVVANDATDAATSPLACGATAESLRTTVLATDCGGSGCHGGGDPAGALDLSRPGWEGSVIGAPASECGGQTLVVPGDPEGSYFYRKLVDTTPACGSRMPKGGALDEGRAACVRAWIVSLGSSGDGGATPVDGASAADASTTCDTGKTACSGACVDTLTDPKNCGACGKACPVACSRGECVTACSPPTTNCGGACVDTTTDSAHCGRCDAACGTGKACTASACTCGASVSFAAQIQPILTRECTNAGCHVGAQPKSSLLLTAGAAYGALVDAPSSTCTARVRVVPGDVGKSYLVNKLLGTGMCAGTQMPKTGGALPANEIDLFRAWICNGAPNN